MKLKNEKEALQMFCDKENGLRPLMTKPFKNERDEGRVWATDGHVLLIVDPKLTRCKYETGRLGLPTFNDDNCDNLITFDRIEEAFAKFELVPEMKIEKGEDIECEECEGTGEVEWEFTDSHGHTYYETHDCPCCDGSGEKAEQKKVPTGRMILPKFALFDFDGATFDASIIMRAVEALRKMGFTEMRQRVKVCNAGNIFHIADGVRLVIMPALGQDDTQRVKV